MALHYRLPCRAPAVCISQPLCSYYCSYSPGRKPQQIEGLVISDAEPTRQRRRGGIKEGEGEREIDGESLQELQYRDRKGIQIIRRGKKSCEETK